MQERSVRLCASQLALMLATLVGTSLLITGCFGLALGNPGNLTAIFVSSNAIRVNQQLRLTTRVELTGVPLTFYVNGIQGGNAEVGTVDASGLYTAPAIVPVPNTMTITSAASTDPNATPGSVTLSVLNPIPVIGSVTPTGFSEGTTTVHGRRFSVCLWRSDSLERRCGPDYLCCSHRVGSLHRRAQSRNLSFDRR